MLLIANSTLRATVTATMLMPAAFLHSQPIRPLSFNHVLASYLHATDLHCICCKKLVQKKLVQETVTDVQVPCANRLVQESCTSVLTCVSSA